MKIGLWGSEEAEGTSVVDYAMYNEFGTSRIPARPFMSQTYDKNKKEINDYIDFLVGRMLDSGGADKVLITLGMKYQSMIRLMIRDAKTWAEPNAPATVAAKGSSSPLIDQGRMINAIQYEVQ